MDQRMYNSNNSKNSQPSFNGSERKIENWQDRQINTFAGCTTTKPNGIITWRALLENLRTGWLDEITSLRQILARDGKKAYDDHKRKLAVFTPCGTFIARNKAELVAHNGIVHHDIDGLTPQEASELKDRLCKDDHIAYCFFSPSYGLKLGFVIAAVVADDQYKIAWQTTADYLAAMYAIKVDPSGKDICRLCFVSHDSEAFDNPAAKLFPVNYEIIKPAEKPKTTSQANPVEIDDPRGQRVVNTVVAMLDKSTDGNRYDSRNRAGTLLGGAVGAGWLDDELAFAAVTDAIERNTTTPGKALSQFASAMEYGKTEPLTDEPDPAAELAALADAVGEIIKAPEAAAVPILAKAEQPDPAASHPLAAATMAHINKQPEPPTDTRRGYLIDELWNLPDPEWQVDTHLTTNSLNMIFGDWGSGKTFYSLDIALSIASGKPFLDSHKVKQAPVAYVIGEGCEGIRKRIWVWQQHYGIDKIPNFALIPFPFDIRDENEISRLVTIAQQTLGILPSCWFFDTLNNHFGSGDENATKDMSGALANFNRLRYLNNSMVTVVHHVGHKDKGRARGANALPGACNSQILVSGNPASKVNISNEKNKDAPLFKSYSMAKQWYSVPFDKTDCGSIVLVKDRSVAGTGDKLETPGDGPKRLLLWLWETYENAGFTYADAIERYNKTLPENLPSGTMKTHLRRLKESGWLVFGFDESRAYKIDPAVNGQILLLKGV